MEDRDVLREVEAEQARAFVKVEMADGAEVVGLELRAQDAFQVFLDDLGYRFVDEGENPAYRLFLA